jgi:membrane protease YdiL (CAAX protease family)
MALRARLIALLGLMVVPVAANYAPLPEFTGAVLAAAFVWAEPASPLSDLGLIRPRKLWRSLSIGIAAGVILFLSNRLLLTPLLEHVTNERRNLSSFDYLRGNAQPLLTLLPTIWLSAGICEEVVYRAYVITRIEKVLGNSRCGGAVGCLVSALVFALAHWYQGAVGMLVTGTLGLAFGFLFLLQKRNLWASIAAHTVGDTISLCFITLNWDRPLDALGRGLFGR